VFQLQVNNNEVFFDMSRVLPLFLGLKSYFEVKP